MGTGPEESEAGPCPEFAKKLQVECRDRKAVGMWSQHLSDVRVRDWVYHI